MKMKIPLALIILTASAAASAQSNGVPGPDDYAAFSRFITDRNIFDPNRVAHDYNPRRSFVRRTPRSIRPPSIELVGTMSYDKGMFAFFSGNSEDLSQVLQVGGKLQGYTITAVTTDSVGLESADKKEQIELKIGDGLREENSKWVFSKVGELPVEAGAPAESSGAMEGGSPQISSSAPTAPPSATEQNEHLKRLMQQREKENQ